jgi:hypothetical protein
MSDAEYTMIGISKQVRNMVRVHIHNKVQYPSSTHFVNIACIENMQRDNANDNNSKSTN